MVNANAPAITLADILAVENDAAFATTRCSRTGLHVWPLIRVPLLRMILSDLLYGVQISGAANAPAWRSVATLARATLHNALLPRRECRRDILLRMTGVGNAKVGDRWFNRLGGHFARAFPEDTLVLEEGFLATWPFPRDAGPILFHAPLRLPSMLAERLRFSNRDTGIWLIDLARARARDLLDWDMGDERAAWLAGYLRRKLAGLPSMQTAYERLLAKSRPKLVIAEEACYGGHLAVLMSCARQRGIPTAEYQHGAVSAGHDAYNLAPALRDESSYRESLPDYFLGYGDWWNAQINVPVTAVAIGNPHRSERIDGLSASGSVRTDLLVLGDGLDTEIYLELARVLGRLRLPGTQTVFRPHPLERRQVSERFPSGDAGDGVRLDGNADIYRSFASARAVVSEISTGLFEAMGLVDRVFVWDTTKSRFVFPVHPFESFSSAEDLAAKIRDGVGSDTPSKDAKRIWADGWKDNYNRFVAGVIAA